MLSRFTFLAISFFIVIFGHVLAHGTKNQPEVIFRPQTKEEGFDRIKQTVAHLPCLRKSHDECQNLLSLLTLRQKIAQLCFVAAISDEKANPDVIDTWKRWQPLYRLDKNYISELITEHGIGGIVFYGKHTQPQDQLALTQYFQSLSQIPLFIALDAECGLASRLDPQTVVRFPCNMTLGAARDPELTYEIGYEVGRQLQAIHVDINFAPVVDVNNNSKNPVIGMRAFGSNPEAVAELGIAYMQGLQDAGIIACAKHFPGHGDTAIDSHDALPRIPHTLEHLERIELYPFQKIIDAGVQGVMTAHLEVPALEKEPKLPSSLSYAVVTDLLQKNMGFQGLVFTDALGMKGAFNAYEEGLLEVKALQAGSDILVCPVDPVKAIDKIEQAVKKGILSEELINQKTLKVLQAKACRSNDSFHMSQMSSSNALLLKKRVYGKAITVVQSSQPLYYPENTTALCDVTKDLETLRIALNCFPLVEIPLSAQEPIPPAVENATHLILSISAAFSFAEKAQFLTETIDRFKALGKEITVVLFCSPYRIPHVKSADTIVVAYENDPDAQIATAEVLLGKRAATGKLPVDL